MGRLQHTEGLSDDQRELLAHQAWVAGLNSRWEQQLRG